MPLIGISKYVRPETRHLIDAAWDDAWRELKKVALSMPLWRDGSWQAQS